MEENKFLETQSKRRFNLSKIIIFASLILLITVSLVVIFWGNKSVSGETVFAAVVGLVGAWVGTILAFYFSKDNFEAASKATQDLVSQITGEQKLKSIPVEEAMIKLDKINYYKLEKKEELIKLESLIGEFKNFNRLPVLNKDLHPVYIIHKSVINQFISEVALEKHPGVPKNVKELTLQHFIDIESNLNQIKNGFVTVKSDVDLASAKKEMELNVKTLCSDIFVTEDGSSKSKVIGWITNQIIIEKSRA